MTKTLSDPDFRAFLAGTASREVCDAIEAALLEGDRHVDARLRALDPLAQTSRDAFAGLPALERTAPIVPKVTKPPTVWRVIAAALVVGLGLGWGAQFMTPRDATDWRMQVAQYQALYVPQTVANADLTQIDTQFERAELALGRALPKDSLRILGDLELARVQVLGFEDSPLIQLAYRDAKGRPFALCLMQGEDKTNGAQELAGLASYSWSQAGLRLILIGGTDANVIARHAEIASYAPLG